MKTIIYASFLLMITVNGCKVAEKSFRKGDYDEAIDICKKKLTDNPDKVEYITLMEEAFRRANGADLDAIKALNTEGRPDRWEQIYYLFGSIYNRQSKIKPLLPLYVGTEERDAEFEFVNATDGLNTAKKNAAAFWYADAEQKMASGDIYQARDAYNEYQKIKAFYSTYQDMDAKMKQAKQIGTNDVVFTIRNSTGSTMSHSINDALNNIDVLHWYGTWYQVTTETPATPAEFTIRLDIKSVIAYPEKVTNNRYEETKQIIDGYEFVYDNQGNIVKDSLGNPIKVPDYKTVTAFVTETWQEKTAIISGELQYLDKTGRIIKTFTVQDQGVFKNYYAVATGYYDALTQASKDKLGGKPLPFPTDDDLLLQAVHNLDCTANDLMDEYNDEYLNQ